MEYRYLRMVDADGNHNKDYVMVQDSARVFHVEYGRYGAKMMKRPYPMSSFWEKYNEKIRKGYKDITGLYMHKTIYDRMDARYAPIPVESVAELVDFMLTRANKLIRREYKMDIHHVTEEMLEEAQKQIDALCQDSIQQFNRGLEKLFFIIPRRMKKVTDYLADDQSDFSKIMGREQKLLDAMAAQVKTMTVPDGTEKRYDQTILEKCSIRITPCTPEQTVRIKKFMGTESSFRLIQAYNVVNEKTEKTYDQFYEENHMSKKDVHLYYHGSLAENWWSILSKGVSINPNKKNHHPVKTAGSMFGNGIYLANRFKKSFRYTDLGDIHPTDAGKGLVAVYKTCYRNPWDIYEWKSCYTQLTGHVVRQHGSDAVYAHKGKDLINDEIIIYDDRQLTIKYLLEVR